MNKSIIAVVSVAVIAGGAWYLTQPTAATDPLLGAALAQDADSDATTYEVQEMALGNPDASVEVIEYASYTCPHCATFHANQYQDIKANYIDTGAIRFVYREVYFDRPGLWASMVARCGGEMRFFGISNLIYERQQDWARAADGEAVISQLRDIGKVAGLSDDELDVCLSDADKAQALVGWYRANAEADNIEGTPSFIINGEKYSNMSYADFAVLLDEKLAEAEDATQ